MEVSLFLYFLVSLHLVCSRDQRQPGHYRTARALLPPLETPLAPLPQSQTGTQSLPGTVVIGGCWQAVGEEIQLDVDTFNRSLKKEGMKSVERSFYPHVHLCHSALYH